MPVKTSQIKNVISGTDKTRAAFARASKNAKGFGTTMRKVGKGIKTALTGAAIGAAALVGAGAAVFTFAKRFAAAEDKVGKFALRLNESTEELSRYQHVAELSGVSNETLFKSFQKIPKAVSDANAGLATAKKAFDDLNLSSKELATLSPTQQFEAIAGALQDVENESDKVRIAQDLMGRSGVEMLQVVNQGTDAIKAMKNEADELGLTISTKAAANAAEFNDTMTRFNATIKGTAREIADELIPDITDVVKELTAWIQSNDTIIKQGLEKTLHAMGVALKTISEIVDGFTLEERARDAATELKALNDESKLTEQQLALINKILLEDLQAEIADTGDMFGGFEDAENSVINATNRLKRLLEGEDIFGGIGGAGERAQQQIFNLVDAINKAKEDIQQEEPVAEGKDRQAEQARQQEIVRLQMLTEMRNVELETEQAFADNLTRITDDSAARRVQAEEMVTRARQSTLNASVGLLSELGKKSKAAALAALVLQKGLMIGQTIASGAAAQIRALAELGPVFGPPAAAKIGAWTQANVGIIAATGLLQAKSALSGGGGTGGGGAGAAETAPQTAQAAPEDQALTSNITLIIRADKALVAQGIGEDIAQLAGDGQINLQIREEAV